MNESRYVKVALDRAVQSILTAEAGKRNETLNKVAYAMGRLVGGGIADESLVEGALLTAATTAGLPKEEAEKTIKSGMSSGERNPKIIGVPENKYAVRTQRAPMPAGPIVSATRWERRDRPHDGKLDQLSFPELVSLVQWPAKVDDPELAPQISFGVYRENHRSKDSLQYVTALVIDADHPQVGLSALPRLFPGCTFVAHSTKRSTPECPRWRAFFPLSRSVSAYEYRLLQEWFDGLISGMDKCPPSQAYYVPISTPGYQHVVQEGSLLDVDSTLIYQEKLVKKQESPPRWELQRDLDARRVCWALCVRPELVESLQISPSDLPGATQKHLLDWAKGQVASGAHPSFLDVRSASGVSSSYIDLLIREMEGENLSDLPLWVGRLQDASLREEAISVLRAAVDEAENDPNAEDSIQDFEIAKQMLARENLVPINQISGDANQWIHRLQAGETEHFFPTGFSELDDIAPPAVGNLVIVGARTFVGKTTFMLQVAKHYAESGIPTLWVSAEMGSRECATRIASCLSGIPLRLMLKAGSLDESEMKRVDDAFEYLAALPLHFSENTEPERITSLARRLQKTHGVQAVFVDYLQILAQPACKGRRKPENRNLELSVTSGLFRDLAHQTGLVVYVASQVNRSENKKANEEECPGMYQLRESGQIEQDANIVYMLHRPKNEDNMLIRVLKNRTTLELGEITRPVENGFIAP